MAGKRPLTPKQQAFVREYLVDLNAAAAARRAGYSARTADRTGHENLKKPEIAAAVAAAQQARAERVEVHAADVLAELKRIAFSRMDTFAAWGPDGVVLVDSATLPTDAAACVAEVAQTTSESGGSLRFKLHDKVQALTLLGKHIGLFPTKVEHSGEVRTRPVKAIEMTDEQLLAIAAGAEPARSRRPRTATTTGAE